MNKEFQQLLGFMFMKTEMLNVLKKEAEEAAHTSKELRDKFFSKQESRDPDDILSMIRIGTQVKLLAMKGKNIEEFSQNILGCSSYEELLSLLGPREEKVEA